MSVKTEIYNKCRICLEEGNIPLYNSDYASESRLRDNVCIFGDIEVRKDDIYPKHLCHSCLSALQAAIAFRQTAKETDKLLKHESQSLTSKNLQVTNGCSDKSEKQMTILPKYSRIHLKKNNIESVLVKNEKNNISYTKTDEEMGSTADIKYNFETAVEISTAYIHAGSETDESGCTDDIKQGLMQDVKVCNQQAVENKVLLTTSSSPKKICKTSLHYKPASKESLDKYKISNLTRFQCEICHKLFKHRTECYEHRKLAHTLCTSANEKQTSSYTKSDEEMGSTADIKYNFETAVEISTADIHACSETDESGCTGDIKQGLMQDVTVCNREAVENKVLLTTSSSPKNICKTSIHYKSASKESLDKYKISNLTKFQCEICHKLFNHRNEYYEHRKLAHTLCTSANEKRTISYTKSDEEMGSTADIKYNFETAVEISTADIHAGSETDESGCTGDIKQGLMQDVKVCNREAVENKVLLTTSSSPKNICKTSMHYKPASKQSLVKYKISNLTRFQCEICHKLFKHRNEYYEHRKLAHSLCTSAVPISSSMPDNHDKHITIESNDKHVCDLCQRQFKDEHCLLSHRLMHENKLTYEKYFKFFGIFNNKKMAQCQICSKIMQKISTISHYNKLHRPNRNSLYLCDICGKKCSTQGNLDNHKTIHTNNFSFKCNICPYKGRNASLLRSHMVRHSEKYYICDLCSKKSKLRNNFMRHVRRHYKPEYNCEVCKRQFYEKSTLSRHFKIKHLDCNKPIPCELCEKEYSCRKNLLKHQFKVHDRIKTGIGQVPHYKTAEQNRIMAVQ